jgi:transposase-like protein
MNIEQQQLLRRLIEAQGLSIAKTAERFGVSVWTLMRWMRKYGVQTLRDSDGRIKPRCNHEPGEDCPVHPITFENQRLASPEETAAIEAAIGNGRVSREGADLKNS